MDHTVKIEISKLHIPEMSREEGAVIRSMLLQIWGQCSNIRLDFTGINFTSISFIDEAIAKLFLAMPREEVLKKLKVLNLTTTGIEMLNGISSKRIREYREKHKESNEP